MLQVLIPCSSCDAIYLESYTSILGIPRERLEAFYGKPVIEADRDLVEQGCDEMMEAAKTKRVAFLVVGDVFGYVSQCKTKRNWFLTFQKGYHTYRSLAEVQERWSRG